MLAIISLLQGVAWGFMLVGTFVIFTQLSFLGFTTAMFVSALLLFIALFFLVALESFKTNIKRFALEKELLEALREDTQAKSA